MEIKYYRVGIDVFSGVNVQDVKYDGVSVLEEISKEEYDKLLPEQIARKEAQAIADAELEAQQAAAQAATHEAAHRSASSPDDS